MPPPDVSLVFLVRILRVQNRHFAIPQKLRHLGPLRAGKISRFVPIDSILRRNLQFERLVRFVVWHVCDRSGAGKEPIAGADARMIRKLGLHFHLADVKLHILKFFDRKMTLQFMQAHRKKGRLHLRGQDRAQTRTCSFITQDPDQILAVVDGDKERQTLDVIPVRVCNEKSQLDRLRSQLLFQRKTETTNPSARVEHDNFAVCPHFYAAGEIIVLDAGTGIRGLGLALEKELGPETVKLTLLITHTHWDHIQGLPFFSLAYNSKNLIRILGYEGARAGLGTILAGQMETPFFPVSLRELPSHLAIQELKEIEFPIGKVEVRSKFANHPGICAGYRLFTSSGSVAYFPDNEPYELLKLQLASRDGINEEEARDFATAERTKMIEFLQGCDVAILDTQYTDEEYAQHIGWGHSSISSVVSLALDANVGKLLLFHHDPNHDDQMIDEMVEHARALVAKSGKPLEVEGAREGAEIPLGAKNPAT